MAVSAPAQADVVVIGAGIGGLTAAGLLSQAGLSVVVAETEPRPGGYLAGFRRGRFVFDTAIHWLNQCGPGGIVHKVFGAIGDDFPQCAPLRNIRRYRGDTYDYLLTSDPDRLRDRLIHEFPGDERGLRRLFRDAYVLGDWLANHSHLARHPVTMTRLERLRFLPTTMWFGIPFMRQMRGALPGALGRYVQSEGIHRIFPSETQMVSVMMPLGWARHGDYQAPPVGGSQAFVKWLVKQIRGNDGTLLLRRRVDEVLTDGDGVAGVRLASGEHVRSRVVLAATDARTLAEKLLPSGAVRRRRHRALKRADLFHSSLTVNLGLDCPVEDLGFGEELVFLARDDVARDDHNNGDPHKTAISILAPSFRDPSMCAAGKGTLTVLCEASFEYGDRWKTGPGLERGPAYQQFKEDYARILLDRVERAIAPGLQDHIDVMEVATPVTHQRYTGNTQGTIMVFRPSGRNIRSGVASYLTGVPGLYHCGHWAEYGGGVPNAVKAGMNASLLVMKDRNPQAWGRLVDIMAARHAALPGPA